MGKSILEFSMPFASTVFTNTSFSLSFSSQNRKLAPYSDSTQNLKQIWLLQHFMEVNTSRAICFLRFRHQISVPKNGVFCGFSASPRLLQHGFVNMFVNITNSLSTISQQIHEISVAATIESTENVKLQVLDHLHNESMSSSQGSILQNPENCKILITLHPDPITLIFNPKVIGSTLTLLPNFNHSWS